MKTKALLLVFASFLLVNTEVSSEWEREILIHEGSGAAAPITTSKYKTYPPLPPVSQPPPPPPVVKTPLPPPPLVVNAPPPPPPIYTAPPPPPPPRPKTTKDCIPLCVERCKLHSRKNVCLRACVTCCDRCKCVPPGQYGNKELCGPCYAHMTTRGGKPKCP